MDKADFAILEIMMKKCAATSSLSAAARKCIQSEMDMNGETLYRRLKKLALKGYVSNGLKEAREHTYYVTESGMKVLREVKE